MASEIRYPNAEKMYAILVAEGRLPVAKTATTIAERQKLPENPNEAMGYLAQAITESIREAKELGVSPEKLAPLYNSLTRALEITAEMKGNLDRSTKILNLTKIDFNKEVEEYAKAIMLSR